MNTKAVFGLLVLTCVTGFHQASAEVRILESNDDFFDGGGEKFVDVGKDAFECDSKSCCNPGTLFQWSQCTSFSGGPAGYDEPLIGDRPDFTEASVTVGRGVIQLETGYTYSFDDDGTTSVRTHSFPETLIRAGILADWLELRICLNYAEERTTMGGASNTLTGAEDMSLGLKIALTPQECHLPETALILQMSLPTGSAPFNNNEVLAGFIYIYAWELNDNVSFAGSTAGNRVLDPTTGNAYTEIAQSAVVGMSLTDSVGGFFEWYGFMPSGADTAPVEHYLDGGFTLSVSNDLQLDVRAGHGLSDSAVDYFVGTGFIRRF